MKNKTMSTKDKILSRLRASARDAYDMPDLEHFPAITYPDPVAQFVQKATTTAGANLIRVKASDDLQAIVRQAYPDARVVATHLPGFAADLNPDTVDEASQLTQVDVGIAEGRIGVAENACIWVPQTMREKAVLFASENLVLVLHARDIVSNMHEAYARIESSDEYFHPYPFGTFISGPSKTADIESALVYGAQAARSLTILLIV